MKIIVQSYYEKIANAAKGNVEANKVRHVSTRDVSIVVCKTPDDGANVLAESDEAGEEVVVIAESAVWVRLLKLFNQPAVLCPEPTTEGFISAIREAMENDSG